MCEHNSLVTTVNAALGGGKKTEERGLPEGVNDVTKGAGSFDQALANMNQLLNWG